MYKSSVRGCGIGITDLTSTQETQVISMTAIKLRSMKGKYFNNEAMFQGTHDCFNCKCTPFD